MKTARAQFILGASACAALTLALGLSLGGYFQSVERGSGGGITEKQLLNQLQIFHDHLKHADSPEEAKAALRMLEAMGTFGRESEGARELKKISGPVVGVFAAKPREAEDRYKLSRKRELMEQLVNAYRKEVLHGDIRLRAGYLNILFDTQNSLLSETDEAEQVYIKKNRERIEGMKVLVSAGGDPTIPARVAAIEALMQSYERGYGDAQKWRAERVDALAKLEKALPGVARAVHGGEDNGFEETRLTFLYVCFISLVIAATAFLALFLGYKLVRVRSDLKMEAFLAYLRGFGTERPEGAEDAAAKNLREDEEWAPALAEARRAEEAFLRSCHTLLAIPRSLSSPCLVVSKEKAIRHWNTAACGLFGFTEGKSYGTQDFLSADVLRPRDGDPEALLELIRASVNGFGEDRFELLVRRGPDWMPYELVMSPISSGPLVGGKVFFWREISSEAERVTKSVATQLARARDVVHKITHRYPVDLTPTSADVPSVKDLLDDLAAFKLGADERELLWKSEAQALNDQVGRQQEILQRLSDELSLVRSGQAEAINLVRTVRDNEGHLHDELCVAERDLERWITNRKRLLHDLRHQGVVLEKARKFEEQLRTATGAVKAELESYSSELDELRQFAEAARVHSVNVSLVRDPGYWEYASRARAFAHELSRFTEKADYLGTKVRDFLSAHPGGALAAHLNSPSLEPSMLDEIKEEQEKVLQLLQRWKETGAGSLQEGDRALALLRDADKKSAVASQLGETSLLINQQAKGNLERWN